MFLLFLFLLRFHLCTQGWWLSTTLTRYSSLKLLFMLYGLLNMFMKPLLTFCNWQGEDGSIIPPFVPLSSEHVSDEGIYLLENGEDALIYIGSSVDSSILHQLFGISSVDEVPTQVV